MHSLQIFLLFYVFSPFPFLTSTPQLWVDCIIYSFFNKRNEVYGSAGILEVIVEG